MFRATQQAPGSSNGVDAGLLYGLLLRDQQQGEEETKEEFNDLQTAMIASFEYFGADCEEDLSNHYNHILEFLQSRKHRQEVLEALQILYEYTDFGLYFSSYRHLFEVENNATTAEILYTVRSILVSPAVPIGFWDLYDSLRFTSV
jgi:hypothetical protein